MKIIHLIFNSMQEIVLECNMHVNIPLILPFQTHVPFYILYK